MIEALPALQSQSLPRSALPLMQHRADQKTFKSLFAGKREYGCAASLFKADWARPWGEELCDRRAYASKLN
jgi:hypothetical protein